MSSRHPAVPAPLTVSDAVAGLCEVLWRERDLLEVLQFRLESQLCLLRADETRWIRLSDEDIRTAVVLVKDCEVLRAMEVQVVAGVLGLSPEATLRELAAASPEPWATLLLDHHRALEMLADGARRAVMQTRRLIGRDDAESGAVADHQAADSGER